MTKKEGGRKKVGKKKVGRKKVGKKKGAKKKVVEKSTTSSTTTTKILDAEDVNSKRDGFGGFYPSIALDGAWASADGRMLILANAVEAHHCGGYAIAIDLERRTSTFAVDTSHGHVTSMLVGADRIARFGCIEILGRSFIGFHTLGRSESRILEFPEHTDRIEAELLERVHEVEPTFIPSEARTVYDAADEHDLDPWRFDGLPIGLCERTGDLYVASPVAGAMWVHRRGATRSFDLVCEAVEPWSITIDREGHDLWMLGRDDLWIWDARAGRMAVHEPVQTREGLVQIVGDGPRHAFWTPDGVMVVQRGERGLERVREVKVGGEAVDLRFVRGQLWGLVLEDQQIEVWNLDAGTVIDMGQAPPETEIVFWNADASRLFTAGLDGVWLVDYKKGPGS